MLIDKKHAAGARSARPHWLRVRIGSNAALDETRKRIREYGLHTVCEAAACPNVGHCWGAGRATFMILGEHCTRTCGFCRVDSQLHAILSPDTDEPRRVAEAIRVGGLREVVITSVTRDDLPDGGAALWAETIRRVHAAVPSILVEVLIPDFRGDTEALDAVLAAAPEVLGHNLETVARMHALARPQADYARSLAVLRNASASGAIVKTSLMLGLGETDAEVLEAMDDAISAGCRILYLGQYLQPSERHLPVERYVTPATFEALGRAARERGFDFVSSAPLVRSSYHEDEQSAVVRRLIDSR